METPTHMISVAIADDHKILRDGIISTLTKMDDINVVVEAENGAELLDKIKANPVDVIILDIKMPIKDGIETLKEIRRTNINQKVIVLTMFDSESYVLKLLDLNANSYLLKNANPQEIYTAIKVTHTIGYYFPEFVKNLMVRRNMAKEVGGGLVEFSERDLNIIRLIAEQKTSAEISKEVFLSVRTVDGIRAKLMERTGTDSAIGLIVYCYKNGYLN